MNKVRKFSHTVVLYLMGIADVTEELMNDSIDWQLGDFNQDGDDFDAIHSYVMNRAIEYLYKTNTN